MVKKFLDSLRRGPTKAELEDEIVRLRTQVAIERGFKKVAEVEATLYRSKLNWGSDREAV